MVGLFSAKRLILHFLVLVAVCTGYGEAKAQVDPAMCGSVGGSVGQYGPFDFRFNKKELVIVEKAHFPPGAEDLLFKYDNYKNKPPGSYTLRAYPNHPRALMLLMNLGEKFKTDKVIGYELPVECYFERALRFAPDDVVVRMIYSMYLSKRTRIPEALQQLALATTDAADNPLSHFNIGMLYFDLKQFDKALEQAHKAMALGFPRIDLKERLQSVGAWAESAHAGGTSRPSRPTESVDGANKAP